MKNIPILYKKIMKDVDKLINDALDAHAKGNLEEARNLYIKTLQITPSNSKALAWLGTLEAMNKNFEYAISLIQKALKIEAKQQT
jgi:Flp pilus assembly protein TadD